MYELEYIIWSLSLVTRMNTLCRENGPVSTVYTCEKHQLFLHYIVCHVDHTLQWLLVSTVFGTVSSLHLTSFLMIFTLVKNAVRCRDDNMLKL